MFAIGCAANFQARVFDVTTFGFCRRLACSVEAYAPQLPVSPADVQDGLSRMQRCKVHLCIRLESADPHTGRCCERVHKVAPSEEDNGIVADAVDGGCCDPQPVVDPRHVQLINPDPTAIVCIVRCKPDFRAKVKHASLWVVAEDRGCSHINGVAKDVIVLGRDPPQLAVGGIKRNQECAVPNKVDCLAIG